MTCGFKYLNTLSVVFKYSGSYVVFKYLGISMGIAKYLNTFKYLLQHCVLDSGLVNT